MRDAVYVGEDVLLGYPEDAEEGHHGRGAGEDRQDQVEAPLWSGAGESRSGPESTICISFSPVSLLGRLGRAVRVYMET